MRSRFLRWVSALTLSLVVAACSSEPVSPPGAEDPPAGPTLPQPIPVDMQVVSAITAKLQCLYGANVIPNPQSTIGKLNAMVAALQADDIPTALAKYQDLINFLNNWSDPSKTNVNALLTCGSVTQTVGAWFTEIKNQITGLLDGLPGELCVIGSTGGDCSDTNGGVSKVQFPANVLQQLTAVYIENNPAGFNQLQGTLDEYPTYVRILTSGISDFSGLPVKPQVVICFTPAVIANTPAAVLDRLLLGALHAGNNFELLQTPPDPGLIRATCPDLPAAAPSYSFFSDKGLGRLANRVVNALLPQPLQASALFRVGGVGGSPEEFSWFGAVDPGMRVGGVGGSPEEFAPGITPLPGAPQAVTVTGGGSTFVGDLDEIFNDPGLLPRVTVSAPASGRLVDGVLVTFELLPPAAGGAYAGQNSLATFCDGTTSYTVATVAGQAVAPCINFGPEPGFKNLRITADPTPIDPLACIINPSSGACATATTSVNYLLETVEPPAELACTQGSKVNKVNFGGWDGTYWTAWAQFSPELSGRFRQVKVLMSVTGRSSEVSDFPVLLEVYRASDGALLATGTKTLQNGTLGNLRLPGDNGSPQAVTFVLTPTGVKPLPLGNQGTVNLRFRVASDSRRTPQLWYNQTKLADTDPCYRSVGYGNGLLPSQAASKDTYRGLIATLNNTRWP